MADPYAVAALLEEISIEDTYIDRDEVHGRCPAHHERTGKREERPRHWSLNSVKLVHYCQSCHYGGKLIDLVLDQQPELGLWKATQLIHEHGIFLNGGSGTGACRDHDEHHRDPSKREPLTVADFYLAELRSLRIRELTWRDFSICPPKTRLKDRKITQEACVDYDIRWDSGWILPICHPTSGVLMGWQRKQGDRVRNQPAGVPKSETLFGLDRLEAVHVLLVESPLDVVYLHSLGYLFSAVASFGAGVSDYQLDLLANSDAQSVTLGLDNDDRGRDGMTSILKRGFHRRVPTFVFDYGDATGKDPGELSQQEIEWGLANATRVPARRRRR